MLVDRAFADDGSFVKTYTQIYTHERELKADKSDPEKKTRSSADADNALDAKEAVPNK